VVVAHRGWRNIKERRRKRKKVNNKRRKKWTRVLVLRVLAVDGLLAPLCQTLYPLPHFIEQVAKSPGRGR